MRKLYLNTGWQMRQAGSEKWFRANVPGSVLSDLLRNKCIDDPYWRTNEYAVRDLFYNDYEYRSTFTVSDEFLFYDCLELVCEGLDTLAEIRINGEFLARTDNMFRTWRFDVKPFLVSGENEISIIFSSPLVFIEKAMASVKGTQDEVSFCPTGSIPGNNFIRKAHYMFGWDWAPQLPDAGIWRDIYLEAFNKVRIRDVLISQQHKEKEVDLEVCLDIEVLGRFQTCNAVIELTEPDGFFQTTEITNLSTDVNRAVLSIKNPRIWWPNGYGEQPLYRISVKLYADEQLCDEWTRRIGLRTITVSTEKDQWGNEFCFVVNGVKIFAMGANYIPQDSILSRVSREGTERLIRSCVEANFNCLRVWGGGYYPEDYFYDLCDEYGLLVWQDHMFACNVYIFTPEFEQNIAAEVRDNVRRIRHHACLALWCGNNEMELGWTDWDSVYNYHSLKLKADYIKQFEYLLPRITKEHDPNTFYWPASPSSEGNFDAPNDENRGDVHYWDVWHGLKPFTDYRRYYFRFCSEFGFQSFPGIKTVESFTLPQDRNIFSRVMESHQKNGSANGRILFYISDYYLYPKDFKALLYISQVLQAEAIRYGVEHWRCNRGRCMGAIYWQLNDCWPVASWSSIDYYGRWKALHYAARRFFKRQTVFMQDNEKKLTWYAVNETQTEWQGNLRITIRKTDFTVLHEKYVEITCPPLCSKPVITMDYTDLCMEYGEENIYVAYTLTIENNIESEKCALFVRPKYFAFNKPKYKVTVKDCGEAFEIHINADTFCDYVELSVDGADPVFSDNYFCIATEAGVTVTADKKYFSENITPERLEHSIDVYSIADSF